MAWNHFVFDDGSNPYISMTNKAFFWMIRHYDTEQIGEHSFRVHGVRPKCRYTREHNREVVRNFAIDWQGDFGRFNYSWGDLADWQDFFDEYGRKYGLLTEFHVEGIC